MAVRDDRGDVKQTTAGFWVHWWCNPSPLLKANSYPSEDDSAASHGSSRKSYKKISDDIWETIMETQQTNYW